MPKREQSYLVNKTGAKTNPKQTQNTQFFHMIMVGYNPDSNIISLEQNMLFITIERFFF